MVLAGATAVVVMPTAVSFIAYTNANFPSTVFRGTSIYCLPLAAYKREQLDSEHRTRYAS